MAKADPKAEKLPTAEPGGETSEPRETLPAEWRAHPGAPLLAEACARFGLDPRPNAKPRQLLSWRYDPGDPDGVPAVPPYVVLVTGGGLKLRWPMDEATEEVVRRWLGLIQVDRSTGVEVRLPLPDDLTLPPAARDGQVRASDHQYPGGYLRRPDGGARRR